LCPSITKCPQEMAKHDFRLCGASDIIDFYHLYWACILGANGGDRWRKKMSWKNKILCPSITKCPKEMAKHDFRSFGANDKNHFITSIGLVY
jgi:hypothetical protein